MKKIFKGFFMANLLKLIKEEQLYIPPDYFKHYNGKVAWRRMLYDKDWVVFTKKPFSTCKHVIDYLGRYSHRVAITDSRILTSNEEFVFFKWKDNTDGGKNKLMRLKGTEFIRRFTMHILPPHFRKIRHYGLISNASKAKSIAQAKIALGVKIGQLLTKSERKALAIFRLFGTPDLDTCPRCKVGKMNAIFRINKNKPLPPELLQKIKDQN